MSHLDRMRYFDRLFRRAGLPVAMSEGFNPRPKFSMALALAVAQESRGELLEADFEQFVRPAEVLRAVEPFLLDGLRFVSASMVSPSAHAIVSDVLYEIDFRQAVAALNLDAILNATSIPLSLKRKGQMRSKEVRPFIRHLEFDGVCLKAQLKVTEQGTLKVSELLSLLGLDLAPEAYLARRRLEVRETGN